MLSPQRSLHVPVARLDVAAGLQPAAELLMVDQEQRIASGRQDERAGGHVAGDELIAIEGTLRIAKEALDSLSEPGLGGVDGIVPRQQLEQVHAAVDRVGPDRASPGTCRR